MMSSHGVGMDFFDVLLRFSIIESFEEGLSTADDPCGVNKDPATTTPSVL